MFCPNCGKNLPPEARFCEQCGSSISAAATPPNTGYASAGGPAAPTYSPPSVAYSGNARYASQPAVPPLSIGSYIGMLILCAIPLVNLILLLVWAFSGNENPNRKNFARAVLILALISIALSVIFVVINASALAYLFGNGLGNLIDFY